MNTHPSAPTGPILVIDDEADLRALFELALLREGYAVDTAATLAQARECLERRSYAVVLTDMRLPDGTGLELLREHAPLSRDTRWIVVTAYGSAESAVEALKAGAFDYLTKPVDPRQLRLVVASAYADARNSPRPASHSATEAPQSSPSSAVTRAAPGDGAAQALSRLIGRSAAMVGVRERIRKAAQSMAPVLILGESGTGKELVARAIHACSHRSPGPFVAVNCAAIPEALLEAEFFGARKGAYTGASQDREGYFQAARGGTLFLDEIGELPLLMQSKLLRVIQERCVRPLGATQEEPVDVRLVSATHRDLATAVRLGQFRQDLYYRLNVIDISVPPLRERLEDLPLLCAALLAKIAAESGFPAPPKLSPASLEQLARHPFPGNVRELENLLHRAVALAAPDVDGVLELDLPAAAATAPKVPLAQAPSAAAALPQDLTAWLDEQERRILLRALEECHFNRSAAARRLGLSLRQIRYRMARLGLASPDRDPTPETDDEPS